MAQARQQYVADGAYVDKQKKEFTLTDEIIEKLDSIEPSAERNAIQGVKVNGELQTPDQYRVVSLTIPEVVDNLDSYDNKSSLSARQGRVLAQQIKNLQSIGKFLSNWNSTTGLPTSNPSTIPYIYKPGDYYIISVVGSANYRPEGTSFDGSSSSTVESEFVDVGDIYMYDDEGWLLLHNSARVIAVDTSLSTSSTNPVENRVITQALNTKQEKIVAGANIQIAQDGKTISATDTTYDNLPAEQGGTADSLVTTGDKYNWDNKQKALTAGANIQIAQDGTISATDTVYGAGANVQINGNIISATDTTYVASDFDIKDLADSTGLRAEWSGKQDELIAGNNIQIAADGKTISATDTTYSAGTNVSIDANNQISAVDTTYTAGANIQISNQNVISATDTVYSAGTNVQINNNVISATDTTYTAGTGINIDANNVISNTQTSAEWGNITGTLSDQTDLNTALGGKQDTLVSGTNIKTINSNSLLGSGNLTLNEVKVSATAPSSPTEGMVWYDTTNDQLKVYDGTNWNVTGKEYNAGKGIEIGTVQDYSAMQGPAPDGFHIPLNTERQSVYNIWTALGGGSSDGTNFGIALKLPFAGNRDRSSAGVDFQGTSGYYWSSSRSNANNAYRLDFVSSALYPQSNRSRAYGFSVRCFKNSPVVPTSSWTKLYGTSIEAGGIFWNSTDGLISLSSDGTTWITIADKNLGATQVWNSGDTLSEANCGGYFQWGNNYMFPFTGSVTTSSTQVDASSYGPGNYYSSSTFITYSGRWDTTDNGNLWGGVTGVVSNAISNTGVLSVNGETGAVTVSEVPSGGNNGDVLTNVSGTPTWQAPTGGIQLDANSPITVSKLRVGTEAQYSALATKSNDTIYMTV